MQEDKSLIRIPLPEAVEGKGSMGGPDAHEYVRETFAREAGGWTEWTARGGWMDGDGELIRERVRMYECVHDREDARVLAREVAGLLAYGTHEDVVMFQVIDDRGVYVGMEE